MALVEVPQAGQLVEVRWRRYIVTEVARSVIPLDPLRIDQSDGQHLVKLVSVEEDAIGKEFKVVRELEPGARLHETPRGTRFTISPSAREEILDRLLALNHGRYAQKVEEGLHRNTPKKRKTSTRSRIRPPTSADQPVQPDFDFELT